MMIVDAHLDLSYNAWCGRPVEQPAATQTPDEQGIPTVGLPDLRRGGVHLICATIFCLPDCPEHVGYHDADEAHTMMLEQLAWYQRMEETRQISFVRTRAHLEKAGSGQVAHPSAILLLEGAEPIRSEADARMMYEAGMRIVGMAWKRTRFCGGTGQPGPLTPEGVSLVKTLDRLGVIHDTSHLAEESFWQLLELTGGPVIASHSNCRAIVPTDRQLSDEMIRALAQRDGVIGINFFDKFLLPPGEYGKRRATLADVIAHMKHICDLAGDARHVGLGTDMDGGLGREQIPREIETSADLPRVAEALSADGFSDQDITAVMSENWARFFSQNL